MNERPDMAPSAQAAEDYGEPWRVADDDGRAYIFDCSGDEISDGLMTHEAGRAVACVNMAAGVPTAALPPAGVLALLLEALEAHKRIWSEGGGQSDVSDRTVALDEAIALLAGGGGEEA